MNADGSGVSHGLGKLEIWEGMCGAEKKLPDTGSMGVSLPELRMRRLGGRRD